MRPCVRWLDASRVGGVRGRGRPEWGEPVASRVQLTLMCLLVCAGLAGWSPVASDAASSSSGGSPLEGSLIVSGLQPLDGGAQAQEEKEAQRNSPEAAMTREASETTFEGLSAEQATKIAGEAFPKLIEEPAGGAPTLPAGETVVDYPSDSTAQVNLGEGKHGVVESNEPLAAEDSSGERKPLNLGLTGAGNKFEPSNPAVGVLIPKRLGEGVQLSSADISLTPVDEHGSPLEGSEGIVEGATVFYANTQADADTLIKPTSLGFETDTLLRSGRSPHQLAFRLGLPEGASLVRASGGSRVVEVEENGSVVALVMPSVARDAAGTLVPVSISSVSNNILTLSVNERPGEFQYPIVVDPSVIDIHKNPGHWEFTTNNHTMGICGVIQAEVKLGVIGCPGLEAGGDERGQYGDWYYTTQGESKIDKFRAETWSNAVGELEIANSYIAIAKSAYEAGPSQLPTERGWHELSVASPPYGNTALFEVVATKAAEHGLLQSLESVMYGSEVTVEQEKGPSVSFDTTDPTIEGHLNAFYSGNWASTKSLLTSKIGLNAYDPGLGVDGAGLRSSNKPEWGFSPRQWSGDGCKGLQCTECFEHECAGGLHGSPLSLSLWEGGELPEGEDTIEAKVEDAVGLTATVTGGKVNVDNTAPYGITVTGLPSSKEIGEAEYPLKVQATDGTGSRSSGVASIALAVDGVGVGMPSGSCPLGPCTATGEWTISGREFGAGEHTLKITATDNAGNVATEEMVFKVHHASPVAMGPGSVNPLSGEFGLSATDVSVSAPESPLSVSRSYESEHLTGGSEGPLGSQWALSVGGEESLIKMSNGNMLLTAAGGEQTTFKRGESGKFTSPTGDSSLTLTETTKVVNGADEFTLKNSSNDDVTTLAVPSNGSRSLWMPAIQEGPITSDTTTYAFETTKGITRPTEALAPVPANVSCAPELTKGCRALTFHYATSTSATGENASQWGEYEGHLSVIDVVAYNPTTGVMATTPVAQYWYDKQGRLRTEWNPQISPVLKATYGYDEEGRVTAMTPPGQQPWLFHYGTDTVDSTMGRLLSVTRPQASTGTGDGIAPVEEEKPKLSTTTPVMGTALSVSGEGKWANSPLAFGYQWEDCNSEGIQCHPILGATNQSYTPIFSDFAHVLVARVTATNANGSTRVWSTETGAVPLAGPKYSISLGSSGAGAAQFEKPGGTALETNGDIWATDAVNNRVDEYSPNGWVETVGWGVSNGEAKLQTCYSGCRAGIAGAGNGQLSTPEGIAINQSTGNVYVIDGDSANSLVQEFSSTGTWVAKFAGHGSEKGQLNHPHGLAIDSSGNLWIADSTNNRVEEFSSSGAFVEALGWGVSNGEAKLQTCTTSCRAGISGSGNGELSDPGGVAIAGGNLYVTDSVNKRVQEYSTAGAYLGKFGESKFNCPWGIATSPLNGDLYVTDTCNNDVDVYSTAGAFIEEFGTVGSEGKEFESPVGITISATTGGLYIADESNNRVDLWVPNAPTKEPTQSPPTLGTSAVTTIDYNIPLEGTGLPSMGEEVETWRQSDLPREATAIFPPDEPMGWPAQGYKRASIDYFDGLDHMVNVASPTGGISTTEYNTYGDVVRHLTPDNRKKALENHRPGEASELLSTKNTYEEHGSEPGTELLSTLEPEHTVKLPSGSQVEARAHIVYSYNEGAPSEGGPYHLVTKMTQGAQIVSTGEEPAESVRTTTTSYSGQANLGWKLRLPTSVTTDPSGLKLTHTIGYEASTGNIKETVTPAGNPSEKTPHDIETIYYTAASNSSYPGCGEHAQWANLPCQNQPAKQPETSGVPNLPVTKITYNMWDETAKTTATIGSSFHEHSMTYDAAGRLKTSESLGGGKFIPQISYAYNEKNGTLEKQSMTSEGKARKITNIYNPLGELESYTDADENTSTYTYDIDGRIKTTYDGKGTQTFTYSETTGLVSELVDSSHEGMKFTATYDVEGNMLSEGYPNGMSANYTYDATRTPTGLEYKKTTHCTEENNKCKWFTDSIVPSIHGQWLEQTSTLSHQTYTYDAAGRLTEAQNTPTSTEHCTTRVYAYDADTNRTSLKTYKPNASGGCAKETTESTETHGYDTADKLTDTGITYSTFGDITTLSAADAGGASLTSTYYEDDQLASQTQSEETIGYYLDPALRTRETVSTGKKVSSVTSHYAGPGESPAWTTNTLGETTRNIPSISGTLAATQSNGEAPILQLTNLHGDIIATAYMSETATELASKADTTEYGVPAVSAPARYSWLGSIELPTELPSGVVAMGARSYVPQLGRFLQPDPVHGGSASAYAYTFGDPVNTFDPSGEATIQELIAGHAAEVGAAAQAKEEAEIAARRAAEEAAAREAAERAAQEAAWAEGLAGSQYMGGEEEYNEEWEEWEEEGEGAEYASYHNGGKSENEEAHAEPAVLVQSLVTDLTEGDEGSGQGATARGSTVPLCKADVRGPCADLARGGQGTCKPCRRRARVHGIRATRGGSWRDLGDAYCGIVGGAALVPGVDVFDAPVEVACGVYGTFRAVEILVGG